MPSTYTQNLGIERPATGEQANTWGDTVNRNMDTLDIAINGNTQLTAPSSSATPYILSIGNGDTAPVAAHPVIVWTGPQSGQGTVQIDWQASRQHLYIMRNQTSGGFPLVFQQGSGSQFVLQAGKDAILYADGGGITASVAAALANPQFNDLLATGNLQVNGSINGVLTTDAQGNAHLTGGLGVGNPAAIPDPLTVSGLGWGQLRLVYGGYGVILRNDASLFYLGVTNAGDPYGGVAVWALEMNLADHTFGMGGWGSDSVHYLNVPSIHTSSLAADGAISAGGLTANGNSQFTGLVAMGWGIDSSYRLNCDSAHFSSIVVDAGITINSAGGLQIASTLNCNGGLVGLNGVWPDQACTVNGNVHIVGGGSIIFNDGTVQSTAATTSAPAANTLHFYANHGFIGTGPQLDMYAITSGIVISSTLAGSYGIGYTASDVRLKQNIEPLTGGLSVVEQLRPVRAEWNGLARTTKGQPLISVLAQELQKIEPAAVYTYPGKLRPDEDDETIELLGLEPMAIISHLILAVQQLNKVR